MIARALAFSILLALSVNPRAAQAQFGQYRGPRNEVRRRSSLETSSPSEGVPGRVPGNLGSRPRNPSGAGGAAGTVARRRVVRYDQEGFRRWEFWWEHNKDRYLVLWNLKNRSSGSPQYDTPDYYLGKDSDKNPANTNRVTDAERKTKILPALLRGVTSTDASVRASSALALGKIGDLEDTYGVLLRLTSDRVPEVRNAALLSLGFLGDLRTVPYLLRYLRDPKTSPEMRFYSAVALGFVREPEVTPYLTSFLVSHLGRQGQGLDEIQMGVLIGLGILKDRSAVPVLLALVRDGRLRDNSVRAMVVQTLGKLGDLLALSTLLRVLEVGEAQERRCAALALGELDFSPEAEKELNDLLSKRQSWADRDVITQAALEQFDYLIQSKIEQRRVAERRLKRFRDRAALRLAEVLKHDNDGQVRNFAAISLGKVAGTASREALHWGLNSGYSRSLQGFCALGLGLLGERDAAKEIRTKLVETYGEEQLRGSFAIAIGLLHDRSAAPDLMKIVQKSSNRDDFRGYAAIGLGLMGYRDAAPLLSTIVESEVSHEDLVRSATLALGLLGDRETTDDLKRALLSGRTETTQGAAAIGHGLLRDFSAVDPLVKLLVGNHEGKAEIRAMAAAALGYLAARDEIPCLSLASRDHNFRIPSGRIEELLRIL